MTIPQETARASLIPLSTGMSRRRESALPRIKGSGFCSDVARLVFDLPLTETVDFLVRRRFSPLSSRAELAFFRERSRGINAERFLFPARFQANRFAAISPRVHFGLRLAHLVEMTNKEAARKSAASVRGGIQRSHSINCATSRRNTFTMLLGDSNGTFAA
jgi:hypothetical protein